MGYAFGTIILICLLNESIKAFDTVQKNITEQNITELYKKELSDVNERDKNLKAMFSNIQESKYHNDEFQPNANSTIISRVWQLFNHCFLTFDNLAKIIQNDRALK
ncbi:unnamed protein product [Schistosoma rodhaini]|uniref:Uncharacterized protein n=1 Tax=Schistosoma rodhaini TaxID=6188 RepID=A0AA85F4D7_9TREM|nr:unnamed protein product [Schistosoma rodhaini]